MEVIEWNHFMTILLWDLYFKIKCWIYRSIFGVLVKKSLNTISFLLIPPNFRRIKIWDFKEIKRNECSLLPILILSYLNFQTRERTFHSFHKNSKTRKWKNILKLFLLFSSIPSFQTRPKRFYQISFDPQFKIGGASRLREHYRQVSISII